MSSSTEIKRLFSLSVICDYLYEHMPLIFFKYRTMLSVKEESNLNVEMTEPTRRRLCRNEEAVPVSMLT